MPGPLVSFVLPCYNYAHYLPDCLNSILKLDGGYDIEIVTVNDGSPDNTGDVLRQFAEGPAAGRMNVITFPKNRGHVDAISEGIRAARGEFLVHTDPDDRYLPQFLTSTLDKFRTYPEVGMVYADVATIDGEGKRTSERNDTFHGGRDFRGNEFVALMESNFICAPTVMARREAWVRYLPVPAHLAFTDWYFTLMMARDFDFYYLNEVLAEYRVHSSNLHTQLIANRGEEPSTFYLLDLIYSTPERTPELEAAKQRARGRVYGGQYLTLARKYFGHGMEDHARRCYLRAFRNQPSLCFRQGALRQSLGAVLGLQHYNKLKSFLRGADASSDRRGQ